MLIDRKKIPNLIISHQCLTLFIKKLLENDSMSHSNNLIGDIVKSFHHKGKSNFFMYSITMVLYKGVMKT